jgi:hypothetical protein
MLSVRLVVARLQVVQNLSTEKPQDAGKNLSLEWRWRLRYTDKCCLSRRK